MRKLLTFLIACATLGGSLTAQVTSVFHEVHAVDQAGPGITTYRIYADLQDADDFLSSVFAAGNDALVLGGSGNVVNNIASGSATGDGLAVGFCGFVPALCFDSFVTIGWFGTNNYNGDPIACGQGTTTISSDPSASVIPDSFGVADGPNLAMNDGAWFTTNLGGCNDNGFGAGPDNRVLIAQVSIPTTDDLVYNLNIQVFNAADGNDPIIVVGDCNTVDGADVDGSGLGLHYPVDPGCSVAVDGCMDTGACNYDSTATNDDGTCEFLSCAGCMNTTACNYDSTATIDDASCILPEANDDCANAIGLLTDGVATLVTNNCSTPDGAAGASWFDGTVENDVWYSFTAPSSGGVLTIETSDDGTNSFFDTQIAVYDMCGGTILADDDDDGAGLYSLLTFDCDATTGLVGGNTYVLQVDGFNGNAGTCNIALTFTDKLGCTDSSFDNYDACASVDDGSCTNAVDGCTDTTACNYNSAANNDDGTCCLDNCVSITVGGGSFDSEISWELYDGAVLVASGFAPQSVTACLPNGCYTFVTFDSYGDGWNGASWTVDDNAGNISTGGLADGYGGSTDGVNVGQNCTLGCMDTTACNYDSSASIDSGDCCFANCLSLDLNDSYGDGWNGAFYDIIDAATSLSVASGTMANGYAQTDGLCLVDGCYTITVGGGSFDSEITWNVNGADAAATGGAGSGTFSVNTASCFGCMDSSACNYDAAAMYDDGSCTFAPCIPNDDPAGASALTVEVLGVCNSISEDLSLAQSDNPEGTAFTLAASADLWYQFTAVTGGARIEVASAGGFDAVVEILDAGFLSVDVEDVSFGTSEILNVGDLTPGATYYLSVCAYDGTPTAGNGDFDICVQYLPETTCDYGSGPYNLCDIFKADWVGAATYTFHFTAVSDGQVYSADGDPWDFIQLFDVPGLPWGDDYTVLIDVKHMLTNVNGTAEEPNVPGTVSCPVTINAPPSSTVKAADNCANFGPKWLGQYIGATPWICGASDWEWEFTRTDVPELAITYLAGTAINYVQLSAVPGLVEGGTYDVRVRAVFPNGATGAYGTADEVCIVGPIGLPSIDGPTVDLLDVEKELSDATVAPEAAIYPNPNNGQILNVNLSGVESTVVTMDIIDMFGKTVQAEQITVSSGNVNEVINLNGIASGVYNVRITMGNTTQTERLIIEK